MALMLAFAGCSTVESVSETASGNIRVLRDSYGVPHIFADTIEAAYFGYGYAAAEDRLFQLEMTRRSAYGRVAEVIGAEFVDFDIGTRRLFDARTIVRQVADLPRAYRAILNAYAAGVNQRIDDILAQPHRLMPREFLHYGFRPTYWDAPDVVMLFVGTLVNRFADYNTELENAAILSELQSRHGKKVAGHIFDALNPRTRTVAPTTIKSDQAQADRTLSAEIYSSPIRLADEFVRRPGQFERHTAASNCIVVGKTRAEGANALLLNGPQFGWFSPSYVYSVGLHAPGFDVTGNTPFAMPAILFGHNGDIAWGSTWGAGDMVDVFELRLNPADPRQYFYRDEWRNFEQRQEIINILDDESITITALDSVYGPVPVHDPANHRAYSKRRTWQGGEVATLFIWFESTRARDYDAWIEHAAANSTNINWYFADRAGNIGYAFTGQYPERVTKHDNRLPASGDGSMDWRGVQEFSRNPQIFNPASGIIANWNNKPGPGVLNPDHFWYSWSRADRVEVLDDLLAERPRWSAEALWGILETSSYADPNARYILPLVAAAADKWSDPLLRAAADGLAAWDGVSRDADRDGYFDRPATPIFRRLLSELLELVLADDLGTAFEYFAGTGYPTVDVPTASGTNIQTGVKTMIDALSGDLEYDFLNGETVPAIIERALRKTLEELTEERGARINNWRDRTPNRPYSHINFLGVPQTVESAAVVGRLEQNRGTENNLIVLRKDGIVAYEVTPPGQSGFLPPGGDEHPHRTDQLDMYTEFGRKRIGFTESEVRAALETEYVLSYPK